MLLLDFSRHGVCEKFENEKAMKEMGIEEMKDKLREAISLELTHL